MRLIVVDSEQSNIVHDKFLNLPDHLRDDDLLVFNDVGISPSTVPVETDEGTTVQICFLLPHRDNERLWEAVVMSEEAPPVEGRFSMPEEGFHGTFKGKTKDFDGGYWLASDRYDGYRGDVEVNVSRPQLRWILDRRGILMHPWYADLNSLPATDLNPEMTMKSGGVLLSEPARRISSAFLDKLSARGIESVFISLWMSFSWNQAQPDQDLNDFEMNHEEFAVSREALASVRAARQQGRRVISIGTSGARALESVAAGDNEARGRTNLFISPGFELKHCTGLLTNLHNASGTHVIMASAFAGTDLTMQACREAVEKNYYFGIHGDSMLLL